MLALLQNLEERKELEKEKGTLKQKATKGTKTDTKKKAKEQTKKSFVPCPLHPHMGHSIDECWSIQQFIQNKKKSGKKRKSYRNRDNDKQKDTAKEENFSIMIQKELVKILNQKDTRKQRKIRDPEMESQIKKLQKFRIDQETCSSSESSKSDKSDKSESSSSSESD